MATIRRKKPESFAILSSPGPWPQVLINWLETLAVIIVFGLIMLFSASYTDRKSTRLNSSHRSQSRMPSSA